MAFMEVACVCCKDTVTGDSRHSLTAAGFLEAYAKREDFQHILA